MLSGGDFGDFFDQQPSSSSISVGRDGSFTLAHELLGLPTMSQAFSAKVRCTIGSEQDIQRTVAEVF